MANTGRNEPCPCGSGKKYKKYCGAVAHIEIKPESSIEKRQSEEIIKYIGKRHEGAVEDASDLLAHKADEFQDVYQALDQKGAEPRRRDDEIPMEIQQQIYTQFMQEHYEKWLTELLPALGNKAPLEAIKTRDGKNRVTELLKSIENAEESNKKQGRPYYDISWMWERLGIKRP